MAVMLHWDIYTSAHLKSKVVLGEQKHPMRVLGE